MARTIQEIQNEIIAAKEADSTLDSMDSTSNFAIWRLITRVVAGAISTLENIYDAFRVEMTELLAAQKPGTLKWYQQKCLDFQLGDELVEGNIVYDNTGQTDDQVAAKKIISQAAVIENGSTLELKLAKEVDGELAPLSIAEAIAFSEYMNEIRDAGVRIEAISSNADQLRVHATIYYDPQILDEIGQRLDGTDNTPVQTAAKAFLRNTPFNGDFVKAHFVDALQSVAGVVVPNLTLCQAAQYGETNFVTIDVKYNPRSGFLKFYDAGTDLVLTFVPYV